MRIWYKVVQLPAPTAGKNSALNYETSRILLYIRAHFTYYKIIISENKSKSQIILHHCSISNLLIPHREDRLPVLPHLP